MTKDADKAKSSWDVGGMLWSCNIIRQKKQGESERFLHRE